MSEHEELSRKVALACGWEPRETVRLVGGASWLSWLSPKGVLDEDGDGGRWEQSLPKFATSLDACFGVGGPRDWLFGHGFSWWMEPSGKTRVDVAVSKDDAGATWYANDKPPAAFCLAFLAAVEANP